MANPATAGDNIKASHFAQTNQSEAKHVTTRDDGFIDPSFNLFAHDVPAGATIDGTTTPQAAVVGSGLLLADANGSAVNQRFHGFVKESVAGLEAAYQTGDNGTTTTESMTIPVGNNMFLILCVSEYSSGSIPSGYTFNGVALTGGITTTSGTATGKIFYIPLGNVATEYTADLVRTGGSIKHQHALVYSNINQSTPFQDTATAINGADPTLTATDASGTVVAFAGGGNSVSIGNAGNTYRYTDTSGGVPQYSSDYPSSGNSTVIFGNGGAATWLLAVMLSIDGDAESAKLYYNGVVNGFTGLSIGSLYYVSDTAGAITTTAPAVEIPVGVAISETEILILR